MEIIPNSPSREELYGSIYSVGNGYNELSIQQNYQKDYLSDREGSNHAYFIKIGGSCTTLTREQILEFMAAFLLITDIYDSNKEKK